MITRWRRAAGLIAATGLLAALPAATGTTTAVASNATCQVDVYDNVPGLQTTVHAGTQLTVRTYYKETRYALSPNAFGVRFWTSHSSRPPGVSVTWLNPQINEWIKANYSVGLGHAYAIVTVEPARFMPPLVIPANQWAKTYFKVNFSKSAPRGTWHMQILAPLGGGPVDSHGNPINVPCGTYWHWKTYTITVV